MNSFSIIKDFRVTGRCDHRLIDIIILSICAVICGADSWIDIEEFGHSRIEWLKNFLKLPNGIPSHDTIGRVFSLINPVKFEKCFLEWVKQVFNRTGGEIIPIDGKTLRRSYDKKSGRSAIHMISAWSERNKIVLGQIKTNEKSNEITAIPQLLELLSINDCIITIDAMGCQKSICEKIISSGGDYVISIKENQPLFLNEIIEHIEESIEKRSKNIDFYETSETDHGRKEIRRYYISDDVESIECSSDWDGLNSIGMVERKCIANGKETINKSYYICSIEKSAENFERAVRTHWCIETQLHWKLDVAFREDECRIRKNNAPENFSILRRVALNLINNEKTSKRGVNAKRKRAGWDSRYLEKVIDS